LRPERLEAIRADLRDPTSARARTVRYVAPWDVDHAVEPESLDLVFSQAVMEHVDDVPKVHATVYWFLRPGGVAVHTTDFKSHGLTRDWYGHWCVDPRLWRVAVQGTRPWLLNRYSHSGHLRAMEWAGFRVVAEELRPMPQAPRSAIAPEFADHTDVDLSTGSSHVIAVKPPAD
jgi:SAM-dependent methyltransferase